MSISGLKRQPKRLSQAQDLNRASQGSFHSNCQISFESYEAVVSQSRRMRTPVI